MPQGGLWLSQFTRTSTGPSLCYQHPSFMVFWLQCVSSLWEKLEVHLESLIFHFSGWQWEKSISVADRTI